MTTQMRPETLSGIEVAHLRHELRTPINQIVGYCEMLLEDAQDPALAHRQPSLTEALAAVRDVTSLIEEALPPTTLALDKDVIQSLYLAMHSPQMRIIDAMSRLIHDAAGNADQSFVADVCRIRDAAERLLPGDRPRAEPTGVFSTPAVVSVPAAAASTSTPGRSARILVVDDVEANRGVLERRLNREGHTVTCVANGEEALARTASEPFDMVLLDVMMPGMDGYETLERLKSAKETKDVPVIMISALDDIASIVRCIERGAEDYLPKPFDPVLLRARISACLEKKILREREQAYMKDVTRVIAASVAVERGGYTTGALFDVAQREDELGTLARVFDNMVSGIKDREQRLRSQIDRLRDEISGVSDAPVESDGEPDLLKCGDLFAERYRIERVIGKGGMGMVYLATDVELNERVAVKTLRADILTSDETAIERFRNEIRLARRIAHRNIVRTHDFGKSGGVFFLTMEFVEGTTLRAVLDSRGHLGADAMLAIAKQLADALRCAHEDGIIHRDIKPQNLLLQGSGTLKVMDFGVARLAERTGTLTQAGLVVGTPTYMAPEQLLDEAVDARSDLYSMGVVLYECLTGRPPFQARSPISLITKILHEAAAPPEAVVPEVPARVSSMVMSLLEKDPARRIQSASDLSSIFLQMS